MTNFSPSVTPALPGSDDITWVRLANGITLLTRPNFNSPSVVINGYLSTGSLYEPDDKLGLAHFTALSLMRGTEKRSFQQIYDAMESIAASLGFGAGTHSTGFSGRSLSEDLPLLLELLADALFSPTFPPEYVERLRAQLLTNIAIRDQDTGEVASMVADEILYRGHPYARPEDGNPATIRAITREDLIDFHHKTYGPRGMVLVIVGAVDPSEAVEQASRVLGRWENAEQAEPAALPPTQPLEGIVRRHVAIAGKSQADLVISSPGPMRRAEDYIAASLGNNILGQFGMMGRIGDVVREQSGLAYYAYTSLNAGIGPGSWEVSAGVNPANLEKAIALIREEIRRFVNEPVSAEELGDSQANYIGRLPLSLESNNGMASALLNLERYDLGLDYYRHYADMVRCVTPENVLEAAQRYLNPDRLAVASAGPEPGTEAAEAVDMEDEGDESPAVGGLND